MACRHYTALALYQGFESRCRTDDARQVDSSYENERAHFRKSCRTNHHWSSPFDLDMPLKALAIVAKKALCCQGGWALCGMGVVCETWSFPRRRESTQQSVGGPWSTLDSRFRGNDCRLDGFPIPRDTSAELPCGPG